MPNTSKYRKKNLTLPYRNELVVKCCNNSDKRFFSANSICSLSRGTAPDWVSFDLKLF